MITAKVAISHSESVSNVAKKTTQPQKAYSSEKPDRQNAHDRKRHVRGSSSRMRRATSRINPKTEVVEPLQISLFGRMRENLRIGSFIVSNRSKGH